MAKNSKPCIPHPDGKPVHSVDQMLEARVAAMDDPATEPAPRLTPNAAERDAIIAKGDEARFVADEHIDAALSDVFASDEAKDKRKAALTSLPPDIMPKPRR